MHVEIPVDKDIELLPTKRIVELINHLGPIVEPSDFTFVKRIASRPAGIKRARKLADEARKIVGIPAEPPKKARKESVPADDADAVGPVKASPPKKVNGVTPGIRNGKIGNGLSRVTREVILEGGRTESEMLIEIGKRIPGLKVPGNAVRHYTKQLDAHNVAYPPYVADGARRAKRGEDAL